MALKRAGEIGTTSERGALEQQKHGRPKLKALLQNGSVFRYSLDPEYQQSDPLKLGGD
jgi:hypothetical protein